MAEIFACVYLNCNFSKKCTSLFPFADIVGVFSYAAFLLQKGSCLYALKRKDLV